MKQKLVHNTKRNNNLQLMKFLAAIMVICSHAYPIVTGNMQDEPLYKLTGGQLSMGGLAVSVFFLAAGYFIASSVEKKNTAKAFFKARCIRIFPLLWIVVFVSTIMGAIITTNSVSQYWTNQATWLYLLNGLLIPIHNLPGVFENAPYLPTVNGALWTLPVEFLCYIACFLVYKLRLMREKYYFVYAIPAFIIAIALLLLEDRFPFLMQIYRPCLMFVIGMGYWIYRKKAVINFHYFCPAILLLILSFVFHFANLGMFVFFPYICMIIWFGNAQVTERLAKVGDMSYGIYLCGFPVQQLLVYAFEDRISIGTYMLLAVLISCLLGYFLTKIENKLKTV